MKPEKLAEIKARLAKPTPEPFKTWLEELVEAVEGKTRPDPVQKLAESVQSGYELKKGKVSIGQLKPGSAKINGRIVSDQEAAEIFNAAADSQG